MYVCMYTYIYLSLYIYIYIYIVGPVLEQAAFVHVRFLLSFQQPTFQQVRNIQQLQLLVSIEILKGMCAVELMVRQPYDLRTPPGSTPLGSAGDNEKAGPGLPDRLSSVLVHDQSQDSGFQRVCLKHNLNFKGWNSQAHRESPGNLESVNLSREILGTARRLGVTC